MRQRSRSCNEIAASALSPAGKDAKSLLDEAEAKIFEIAESGARHNQGFQEIQPLLSAALRVTPHPEPWEDAPKGRTNYEIKYLVEGRPIYRLTART